MIKNSFNKKLNLSYKCLYLSEEGIVFLFEKIDKFDINDIEVRYYDGEVFITFGNNIALLTKKAIDVLKKNPRIYLCSSELFNYEGLSEDYYLEVDDNFLARLEGALDVIKSLSVHGKTNHQSGIVVSELNNLKQK